MKRGRPCFEGSGYWAVILGGSSGLGLAAARKLAREGMHLCIVHRDRRRTLAAFQEAAQELRAEGVRCATHNLDALRPESREEVTRTLADELGPGERVRLLLHAVSRGNLKPVVADEGADPHTALDGRDLAATVEAMALSLHDWVRALFDARLFAADARVIGLTSEGSRRAWPSYAAVACAKGALEALCRSLALELAPHGIRCNLLQPGVTDTPSLRMIPGSERLREVSASRNPFRRLTRPEDVADVLYLMCRDEAAWINGAIVPVDGGERIT